jgi:histone acetyltransferase SAS3
MAAASAPVMSESMRLADAYEFDREAFDEAVAAGVSLEDNADAYAANIQLHSGMARAVTEDEGDEADEEAMLSDEDAEGEDDDEMVDPALHNGHTEDDEDASEDDEDEGVGAVKIQPGLLDDDEDAVLGSDDEESAASIPDDDDESKGSTDAEVEEQWEQAAEEEEEEEPANPNRCMYVQPPLLFRKRI